MSTWLGRARLVLALLLHVLTRGLSALLSLLTLGLLAPLPATAAPGAACQYFVDAAGSGEVVGRAEACVSLGGIALRFSRRDRRRGGWARLCPEVPMGKINMQAKAAAPLLLISLASAGRRRRHPSRRPPHHLRRRLRRCRPLLRPRRRRCRGRPAVTAALPLNLRRWAGEAEERAV